MRKLNIWLLQTGEPLHTDAGDPRPMRAMNLANALTAAGHSVVLWSSAFYHQEKRHRSRKAERLTISPQLEIRLIPSSGYERNIGFARLWDHIILARNLKHLLKEENTTPDVAFLGYPPIETASIMGRWLAERDVPTLLDVKDLWPSVFLEAVPISVRPLGRIILAPYFMLAEGCVKRATGVCAMANSFLDRVNLIGKRNRSHLDGVFPLTSSGESVTDSELLAAEKWWLQFGVQNNDKFRVCYIGNLSSNVDLSPVKEAATIMNNLKLPVEFLICGNGVSLDGFKNMMKGLPNVQFPGRIDRAHVLALAQCSHASLIPYVNSENFQLSLPNKSIDALSLGLPILSPLQGEVAKLISTYKVGMSYGENTGHSLFQCIEILMKNASMQRQMSKSAKYLFEEKFSFQNVYGGLVKHIEMISLSR